MHSQLKLESLKGQEHMGGLGLDGRIILKWIIFGFEDGTRFKWFRIGSSGGLL
jgi:hypothetical protein